MVLHGILWTNGMDYSPIKKKNNIHNLSHSTKTNIVFNEDMQTRVSKSKSPELGIHLQQIQMNKTTTNVNIYLLQKKKNKTTQKQGISIEKHT